MIGSISVELRVDEAVRLCSAQLSGISGALNLRALIIKGPLATRLGVRPQRPSSDVDVLVHPDDFVGFSEALRSRGWTERPNSSDGGHPLHSRSFINLQWPIDIDVHYKFPGFDGDDRDVFDELWKHSQIHVLAESEVRSLDLAGATIVQALHSLREMHKDRNVCELEFLLQSTEFPDWSSILELALATGSIAALKPFLTRRYSEAVEFDFPPPSENWCRRTSVTSPGVHRLLYLREVSLTKRPALIFRALYPTAEALAAEDLSLLDAGRIQVQRVRLRRIGSFFRSIVLTMRQYKMFRN